MDRCYGKDAKLGSKDKDKSPSPHLDGNPVCFRNLLNPSGNAPFHNLETMCRVYTITCICQQPGAMFSAGLSPESLPELTSGQ